ncbi:hypothetical protein THERMOS_359 [Bathymodiolus thermophilus thioautotrophic gill symbiont]|uniref:Uncharacterized protein n=1 Tax=Bathymodiolus thermophilus thioautotrophic gill symbiont TaxID=2360 RepID=A0A8H9CGP7_9GAMM|nr:hypothetical protein THERMOS_359 [Bathymodiolus thermophilus thioautotrophic gill symbiont]
MNPNDNKFSVYLCIIFYYFKDFRSITIKNILQYNQNITKIK